MTGFIGATTETKMDKLYKKLKNSIISYSRDIYCEEFENYDSYKIIDKESKKLIKFADVYVLKNKIRIQTINVEDYESKSLEAIKSGNLVLNQPYMVNDLDDINDAIEFLKLSFIIVHGMYFNKALIRKRTHFFVFHKDLEINDLSSISYESKYSEELDNDLSTNLMVRIENLQDYKFVSRDYKSNFLNKLFADKKAALHIYNCKNEQKINELTQNIKIYDDKSISISCRVDNNFHFTNIIENLKSKKSLHVWLFIDPDNDLDESASIFSFKVSRIKISFRAQTIKEVEEINKSKN